MAARTFPGRYGSLAEISEYVKAKAQEAGFSEKETYAVQLAVDEACSNIIEHAYGGEDLGDIELTCDVTEDGLKIILRDKGDPFDPESVPAPNTDAPLEQIRPGGAGLFLMRKMMDEVRFDFKAGKGTELTMVKRRRQGRSGS